MTCDAKLFTHYGSKCLCRFKFRTRNSHIGVNKLIREILIEKASFHILHLIKLFHTKIRKTFWQSELDFPSNFCIDDLITL